jgi:hypothetical protein
MEMVADSQGLRGMRDGAGGSLINVADSRIDLIGGMGKN